MIEIQTLHTEDEHTRTCSQKAAAGATRALRFLGAQEAFESTRGMAVGRIVIDVRGYDGICPTEVKKTREVIRFSYVDKSGTSHESKQNCLQANRQNQNVYLRVTPIEYQFKKRKLARDFTGRRNLPGYTKELKLRKKSVGQLQLPPINTDDLRRNDQQYEQCENWTRSLMMGLAQEISPEGLPVYDKEGNPRFAEDDNILTKLGIRPASQDKDVPVIAARTGKKPSVDDADDNTDVKGE